VCYLRDMNAVERIKKGFLPSGRVFSLGVSSLTTTIHLLRDFYAQADFLPSKMSSRSRENVAGTHLPLKTTRADSGKRVRWKHLLLCGVEESTTCSSGAFLRPLLKHTANIRCTVEPHGKNN